MSTLEGKCLTALRQVKTNMPLEISINPLNTEIRKNIAEKFLAEYNKKLDDEQVIHFRICPKYLDMFAVLVKYSSKCITNAVNSSKSSACQASPA